MQEHSAPLLLWPREYARRKDSAFASVAAAAGGGRALRLIPLSPFGFPETAARTDEAMRRAKKQPRGLARHLKRLLIRWQYNGSRRCFERHPETAAMAWNGLTGSRWAFLQAARDAGRAALHLELAPLPGRITLDPVGVNAESSVPRERAFFDHWAAEEPGRSSEAWRRMGEGLVARGSRRADVGQGGGAEAAALQQAGPFLFVPMQVPDDSQMRLFAGWAEGLDGFIAALGAAARALPVGWHLRVKEHPSARVSVAEQLQAAIDASGGRIVIDNATDSFAQLTASRGVLTINSSMGLQAFFHDKPVIATGAAFWALPGLVVPADSAAALATALAGAAGLGFDPVFRARFMNWLDQVYYPRLTTTPEGDWQVDPAAVGTLMSELRLPRG